MSNYPTTTDNASMADTYNGWANYETWNVSLYINNEYPLYRAAVDYVTKCRKFDRPVSYVDFTEDCGLIGTKTPDDVKWNHSKLDYSELDEMLEELVD